MSHPWSAPAEELPFRPAAPAYGWIDQDGWHGCTREELEARCAKGDPPVAVWTPEAERVVLPGEVAWLHEALARGAGDDAARPRTRLLWAALGVVLLGTWWYVDYQVPQLFWFGVGSLAVAAMLWVTAVTRRRQRTRTLSPEEIAHVRAETAHARWLRAQRVTYTNWVAWTVAACFAVQLFAGFDESIVRAGLLPDRVAAGEWWRLVTAPLLHVFPLHFILNYAALVAFARMLEVHAHRAYVPLVFLVTAACGSAASLVLPPDAPGVGASGGILGLLGALLALGALRRRHLPPRFTRGLWASAGATAVLGLVGWAFIDNGAHLGGVVSGGALGLLCFLPHRDADAVAPGPLVRRLGDASMGLLWAAAAWAVAKMLGVV